jgi:hypothetical protein
MKKKLEMIMIDKVNKRKRSRRNQPIKKARKRLEPKRLLLMSTQKIQILEWAGIPNQSNIEPKNKSKKMKRMKSSRTSWTWMTMEIAVMRTASDTIKTTILKASSLLVRIKILMVQLPLILLELKKEKTILGAKMVELITLSII